MPAGKDGKTSVLANTNSSTSNSNSRLTWIDLSKSEKRYFDLLVKVVITTKAIVTLARKRAGKCSRVCPCIYVYKKIVIERTRDLIYLKLAAKDFFPKIISSCAGENASDSV